MVGVVVAVAGRGGLEVPWEGFSAPGIPHQPSPVIAVIGTQGVGASQKCTWDMPPAWMHLVELP